MAEDDEINFKQDEDDFSPRAENLAKWRKEKRKKEAAERKSAEQKRKEDAIKRQEHMNKTQFREPEDNGPNPNWVPPPPGSPGGPPLPKPKDD